MANGANIIEVQEATFEQDVIQKSFEKPVVVDFWAAWCGPCRMLGPILERLAAEPNSGFILAKVDVDRNQGLAMRYGIQGIPAVKAFHKGQVVGQFVGAQPEPNVRQFIKSIAPSESDQALDTAETLIREQRWEGAESIFRQYLSENPADSQSKMGLAKALLGQGRGCESKFYIESAYDDPQTHEAAERLEPFADYLCNYAERADKNAEVTAVEGVYRRSATLFAEGQHEEAMEGLLDVLRHNRDYRDGQVRKVLLGIFEFLGNEDPLTQRYRAKMASVIF